MEIHFRRVDNFLLPPPLPLRWLRTWWGEGGGRCQICSLQPFHRNLLAPLLLPRNFCILRSPLAPPPARGPPKSRANLPTFPPPPPALRVPMANLGKFLWGGLRGTLFPKYSMIIFRFQVCRVYLRHYASLYAGENQPWHQRRGFSAVGSNFREPTARERG